MKRVVLALILISIFGVSLAAPAGKLISETIEIAAKKSGRVLSLASKEAASEMLEKAVAKYGDEVYDIVKKGGLEALEQGSKHSDDFWTLCSKNHKFVHVLTKNADELIPLAKRIGPEVLEFEIKNPGMASRIVSEFGDDAAKKLLNVPSKDVVRLTGYAKYADTPATKKVLFDDYLEKGDKVLKELEKHKKLIITSGLTVAIIKGIDNASSAFGDGIRDGIRIATEKAPLAFHGVIVMCVAIIVGVFALFLWPVRNLISSRVKKEK